MDAQVCYQKFLYIIELPFIALICKYKIEQNALGMTGGIAFGTAFPKSFPGILFRLSCIFYSRVYHNEMERTG